MTVSRRQFIKSASAISLAWPAIISSAQTRSPRPIRFTISIKRLDLQHTWTISRNSSDYKDNVFVCIERDGIQGWGEAAPNVRYNENATKTMMSLQEAQGLFEKYDWFNYVDLQQKFKTLTTYNNCTGAALDIALLDWVGQKLNVPLYRLFGLDPAKAPLTSFSIGIDTPQVVREKVKQADQYPILKIKVGRDNDAEILAAVRDVTDKPLRVDANEGWKDKHQALEKIRWLQNLGVELIEQPMPARMLEETAWLRSQVDIPIIADEAVKNASDIPKLAVAYDGINIKLMKAGGIQEALRMIHVARAMGMKIMLGCMIESSVAISAATHLSPLIDYADLDGNLLISNDPFTAVTTQNGQLILNDRPGLGINQKQV